MRTATPLTLFLAPLALFACFGSEQSTTIPPAGNDPLKAPVGLEHAALIANAENPLTVAKAELGKQLFFDPRLSGTGTMACNACHYPELAFTDGKALSKKDDGNLNTRNAPTMHNVGYLARLYWDGRAKSLEANVLAAWKGQIGGKPEEVAKKLAEVPAYAKAFQEAFGAAPSEATIVNALASFLRALRSGDSAYDRHLAGEANALSSNAKAGMELFFGKAGCTACHAAPLFTNASFHNTGIGMGAEKPDIGAAAKNAFDDPTRTGQFKTPTLRDVAKSAPYFHDGSVPTLREAVKLMASGGLANAQKDPLLTDRQLGEAEIDQLVAFLESLSGNVSWTAPVVPQ